MIIGNELANIPWENKPENCIDVIWRYSRNPIIDWNPIPKAARVFNSAVVPFGICRCISC
jgi:beta-1,4-mannooligosaccharide/beta-1,4-mannosyl-N-acetylglucosamine phosphorylase